jgi:hypothetical protein
LPNVYPISVVAVLAHPLQMGENRIWYAERGGGAAAAKVWTPEETQETL